MSAATQPLVIATTALFVALCILSDLRTLRIPNAITGPAILIGIALNGWYFGWTGLQTAFAGFGLLLLLLLGPFALGGVGAGDVKMMCAVGALLGPRLGLYSVGLGFVLGGVFAVIHLTRLARLREKLGTIRHMVTNAVMSASVAPLMVSPTAPDAVVLPYSVPLGLGTLGVLALAIARSA